MSGVNLRKFFTTLDYFAGRVEKLIEFHQFRCKRYTGFPQSDAVTMDRIAIAMHCGRTGDLQRLPALVEWRPAPVYFLKVGDAFFRPTIETFLNGLDYFGDSLYPCHVLDMEVHFGRLVQNASCGCHRAP